MNRQQLTKAIKDKALMRGTFTLSSGKTSNIYFDKYQFESDPILLFEICQRLASIIPYGTQILCGLAMGGIPLAVVLSQITGIPVAFLRTLSTLHWVKNHVEGPVLKHKRIVVIDDIITTGSSIMRHVEKLRGVPGTESGIIVDSAICVIDRQMGGAELLAKQGVGLYYLFTAAEIEGAVE